MNIEKNIYIIKKIEDYKILCQKIIPTIKHNDFILLYGDLGAGKTTFTQFFLKELIAEENVTSPTFNILQIYENDSFLIHHYDLYRLKYEEELYEIMILSEKAECGKKNISIIEWPEVAENYLKKSNQIKMHFSILKDESRKIIMDYNN